MTKIVMPASSATPVPPLHRVTGRETALLIMRVVEMRTEDREKRGRKPLTRAQLTIPTLKRLSTRDRLSSEFIQEVSDWLLPAGWVLFDAGRFFGLVRTSAVENWPRLSSQKIDLKSVKEGRFPFHGHEHLLWGDAGDEGEAGGDKTSDAVAGDDDE